MGIVLAQQYMHSQNIMDPRMNGALLRDLIGTVGGLCGAIGLINVVKNKLANTR